MGLIKRVFYHKNVNFNDIESKIKELGLQISHSNALENKTFIQGRSYVYFPVVPRDRLSAIHLVFVDAIEGLKELGLKVKILVFDDYYRRVKKHTDDCNEPDIENFIAELRKFGIKKHDIKLESKYVNKAVYAKKTLYRIKELCSKITIEEIEKLRKETSSEAYTQHPYIRQQKIFYNLAYVSLIDNVGFVLCGEDELAMWGKFVELEKGQTTLSKLVILYIPQMASSKGDSTCIWDEQMLFTGMSKETIAEQLTKTLDEGKKDVQCNIFYLLDHLYFAHKNTIEFIKDGERDLQIKSVKALIDEINDNIDDKTKKPILSEENFKKLVDVIYEALQPKKE